MIPCSWRADKADWLRRLADFHAADGKLHGQLIAPPGGFGHVSERDIIIMLSSGPVPLDYQYINFLTDLCDFDSPEAKAAPPGLIHPDDD
jgi:hypothetical protein